MPNLIEIVISGKNEAKAAIAESKADGEGLGSTMTKMGVVSGLALAGIAVESVKMASEFQSSTTRLVTSAGESTANIDMVRKGMLDMAGQVGISANELSKGMYTVESAGFHGADGLTVLKSAAQGAKDENADLAKVANAVTDVLVDYHMKATDSAKVTSEMIAAVSFGKTSFDDFSGSMHNILPLASAMHLSFADVSGVLAEMTAHGMSADQASQNMANAMRSLIAPTGVQTKEFQALGISADIVREKLSTVGLSGTMEFLAETAKKVGPNVLDQEAALKKLMGTAPGLSVALMTTGENFASTTAAIKGISGATADANGNVAGFAEMQKTLGQKVAELTASFDSLMIELGNKLIPVISSVVDWMNKHKAVVTDVIVAVGLLAAGITAWTVVTKLASLATTAWGLAQVALKAATEGVTVATEALGGAMMALPLVAVAAGVTYLLTKFGSLSGTFDKTTIDASTLKHAFLDLNAGTLMASTNISGAADSLMYMSKTMNDNKPVQGLKDMDATLAAMVASGNGVAAAKGVSTITAALQAQGVSLGYIHDQVLPKYNQALADQAAATNDAAGATDGLTDAQNLAKAAQDSLTTSVAAATQEYDAAKKAATGYQDTIDALFGKYGSYSDSQAKLTLAMKAAEGQLTKGKDAIDLHSAAGAKNFQTLQGLSKANMDLVDNMIRMHATADDATAAMRKGAQAIDDLAGKSGFTKDQIKQLNLELYGVPNVVDIKVSADVSSAVDNVNKLNNALSLAASAITAINTSHKTKGMALAHGGEVGSAATGGNRSGLLLVGEDGPEMVRLPTGSTVRSNPNTMADLAGAGSGGGGVHTVQLELVGADQEFLTFLKKIIRVRGGNGKNSVQTVLGQAF